MTQAEKMQARHQQELLSVANFKVGDLIQDKSDTSRTDVITEVRSGVFGGVEYCSTEINAEQPKRAMRFEQDIVRVGEA